MYFDRRLWAMMAGLRWRVAAAVALGLLAMGVGILRFVFLGRVLALVFRRAGTQHRRSRRCNGGLRAAARVARPSPHGARAAHGRARAGHAARAAVRPDRRTRPCVVQRRTHGRRDVRRRRRRAIADLFGTYLPAVIAACAVMIFAVLAWWDVPTAAILLVAALVTLALPQLVHRADKRAALARSAAFKAFGEEFLDAVQGLPTLKAFGQRHGIRREAGREGARAVRQHVLGARARPADAALHRSRHRPRRGRRDRGRRVARAARRHEP